MGLTVRTRNEVQFVELMARTRALDNDSWRKPHYYEHLKKLHAQLSKFLTLKVLHHIIIFTFSKNVMDLYSCGIRASPKLLTCDCHAKTKIFYPQRRLQA